MMVLMLLMMMDDDDAYDYDDSAVRGYTCLVLMKRNAPLRQTSKSTNHLMCQDALEITAFDNQT